MVRTFRVLSVAAAVAVAALFATREVAAQPAPPLTEMYVCEVSSSARPAWEPIKPNSLSTPNDLHGGTWLKVKVFERGYATGQVATFNGTPMKLYESEMLSGADRRVYGFYRYYYVQTRFTSGRFACSARSLNFPRNTISIGFNVR